MRWRTGTGWGLGGRAGRQLSCADLFTVAVSLSPRQNGTENMNKKCISRFIHNRKQLQTQIHQHATPSDTCPARTHPAVQVLSWVGRGGGDFASGEVRRPSGGCTAGALRRLTCRVGLNGTFLSNVQRVTPRPPTRRWHPLLKPRVHDGCQCTVPTSCFFFRSRFSAYMRWSANSSSSSIS